MLNIGLFWGTLNYQPLKGWDSLLKSYFQSPSDNYNFVSSHPYVSYNEKSEIGDVLYKTRQEIGFPDKYEPLSKIEHSFGFKKTWNYFDIDLQILAEDSMANILLQHTFPLSIKRKSFIFHFENIRTLFLPLQMCWENDSASKTKEFLSFIDYLKGIFEDESCLSVTTHYTESFKIFQQYFPEVSHKAKLIPAHQIIAEPNKASTKVSKDKNILFFDTKLLNSMDKTYLENLKKFLNLCLSLVPSDNLKPVIILDRENIFRGDFISANVVVMEPSINSEILKEILTKSRFLFNPSNEIETNAIYNCIKYDIIPLIKLFPAYKELSFRAEVNCIDIASENLLESPLGFKSKKISTIATNDIIKKIRKLNFTNTLPKKNQTINSKEGLTFEKLILTLSQKEKLKTKICTQPKQTLFEINNKSILTHPTFHNILKIDFLQAWSNGKEYIYSFRHKPSDGFDATDDWIDLKTKPINSFANTSRYTANNPSLRFFFIDGDTFEKNHVRIFKDLKEFTYAYEWSFKKVNGFWFRLQAHSLPSRFDRFLRTYNKQIKNYSGPFHPMLKMGYILQRALYRIITNKPPYFK